MNTLTQQSKQIEHVSTDEDDDDEEEEEGDDEGHMVDDDEVVEDGQREGDEMSEDSQPHSSISTSQPLFGPFAFSHKTSESQNEKLYEIRKIRKFLEKTKNMKYVQLGDHFKDTALFFKSVRSQLNQKGEGCFTQQEVYRLKKWLSKSPPKVNNESTDAL